MKAFCGSSQADLPLIYSESYLIIRIDNGAAGPENKINFCGWCFDMEFLKVKPFSLCFPHISFAFCQGKGWTLTCQVW